MQNLVLQVHIRGRRKPRSCTGLPDARTARPYTGRPVKYDNASALAARDMGQAPYNFIFA